MNIWKYCIQVLSLVLFLILTHFLSLSTPCFFFFFLFNKFHFRQFMAATICILYLLCLDLFILRTSFITNGATKLDFTLLKCCENVKLLKTNFFDSEFQFRFKPLLSYNSVLAR